MTDANNAGAKHGSNAKGSGSDAGTGKPVSGLQESSGEFNVGGKIILGMANGNIRLRHSPQGDEVEVSEATLAGLLVDAFFTDKFEGQYETVKSPR
jgi:hypothetical protein